LQPFGIPVAQEIAELPCYPGMCSLEFIYMPLAVVTATTGILKKATFLQTNNVISSYSTEAMLVNSLGILIVVLGGFVTLAIVTSAN
jgi:hypothetical protein